MYACIYISAVHCIKLSEFYVKNIWKMAQEVTFLRKAVSSPSLFS